MDAAFNNYGDLKIVGDTHLICNLTNAGTIYQQSGLLELGYYDVRTTNRGAIVGNAGTAVGVYYGGFFDGTASSTIQGDLVFFNGHINLAGSLQANRTIIGAYDTTVTGSILHMGEVSILGALDLTNAMFAPEATTLDSLNLSGSLTTNADITVAGQFTWNNGTLRGANGQGSLTVLRDTTLNGNYKVQDFSLINAGHAIWTGGTVNFFGDSRFTNTATATFDDQIDGTFGSADNQCPIFDNQGLFIKSGGNGTTDLHMELYNSGTVRIDRGTLDLGCGYVQVTGGGSGSGGSIGGSGSFTGDVTLRNPGQLIVDPAPVAPPPVTNYTQTVTGSLVEQIGGLIAGTQYGQIIVNNGVSLNGTLRVNLINGFISSLGNQFTVIDNRGTSAVQGTFLGLSEGTTFTAGLRRFQISYIGGNGNDVTLTDAGPSISNVTVSVSGGTFNYDGLAHGATSSGVTGDNGFSATPTLAYYVGTNISGSGSQLAPINAGVYTVVASYAGDANHNPGSASAVITITQKTLRGDATTQDALNTAKQGKLNITVSNISGFANGDALATFLNTALYNIRIGITDYEFVPTTVTALSNSSFAISYTLKDSALLTELGTALDAATSGAKAVAAGFFMESTNYTLFDSYLTRMFSTIK